MTPFLKGIGLIVEYSEDRSVVKVKRLDAY